MQAKSAMTKCGRLSHRLTRWLGPSTTYIWLSVCCAVSLAISIGFVQVDLRFPSETSKLEAIALLLLFFLSLVVPISVVVLSIIAACQRRARTAGLGVLLAAYLVIILCFSGFYYSVTYIEDYNDCVNRFCHFEAEFAKGQWDSQHPILEAPPSERAFDGMRHRLWQLGEYNDTVADEIHDIKHLIRQNLLETIHPVPDAKLPVFTDCLHLSVGSMTLFGYGQVTPCDWKVKMANSLEVLTGTLLLAVLLGMLFADWDNDSGEDGKPANK